MSDTWIQFGLCTVGDKGQVHLSDAGLDVVRAILIRWCEQAQNGEDAARAMGQAKVGDYSVNQAAYFKAAKTFLLGKLVGQLTAKMNLRTQLAEALSWRSDGIVPDRWAAAVAEQHQNVNVTLTELSRRQLAAVGHGARRLP